MSFEGKPTTNNSERSENIGAPQLSDFKNLIHEKITLAQKHYDEVNKEEWEMNEQGFPIQPRNAADATARLEYLKKARSMFTFSDLQDAGSPSISWEDALKRAEDSTKLMYDRYVQLFGARDPKDVEESQRDEAKKQMDEIKLRDKIVSEFSNITL